MASSSPAKHCAHTIRRCEEPIYRCEYTLTDQALAREIIVIPKPEFDLYEATLSVHEICWEIAESRVNLTAEPDRSPPK